MEIDSTEVYTQTLANDIQQTYIYTRTNTQAEDIQSWQLCAPSWSFAAS